MNFHESRIELNSARASTIIRRVLIGCISPVYQLYFSQCTNYISLIVSTVFLLYINFISLVYRLYLTLYQQYFPPSPSIHSISLTAVLYEQYF